MYISPILPCGLTTHFLYKNLGRSPAWLSSPSRPAAADQVAPACAGQFIPNVRTKKGQS